MNDFERAELRALASLLEDWPTSDKTALGYSNDVVAILDSKSDELHPLRAQAGHDVNEWLSVEGAGRTLGIGPQTVYGLINRGELVAYRIGRVYRIRIEDIAAYLESARVKPGDLRHLMPENSVSTASG
jgi:excisionase family DNA binding protein